MVSCSCAGQALLASRAGIGMRGGGWCGGVELQMAKLRVLPRLLLLGVHWACCACCGQVDLASLQPQLAAAAQLTGQERISPTLDEILRLLGEAPGPGAAAEAEDFVRRVAGGSLVAMGRAVWQQGLWRTAAAAGRLAFWCCCSALALSSPPDPLHKAPPAAAAGDVQPAPSGSLMQTSTFSGQQAAREGEDGAQSGRAGGAGKEEGGYTAQSYDGAGPGPQPADLGADYEGGLVGVGRGGMLCRHDRLT